MSILSEISLASLATAGPNLPTQLVLLVIQAVFWHCFLCWFADRLKPWTDKQPWRQRWLDLNDNGLRAVGIELDDPALSELFALRMIPIMIQHCIGGIVCLPSVLGWGDAAITAALARHGALSEGGFELSDLSNGICKVLFRGEEGRKMYPFSLRIVMLLHHTMGLSMIIPMNLICPDNRDYHHLVSLLQFAAFLAMVCQQYGYTLDVSKPSDLFKMQVMCALVFLNLVYSRALAFGYTIYRLLMHFWSHGLMRLLVGGCIATTMMSVFNVVLLLDAHKRLLKFMKLAREFKTAPPKETKEKNERIKLMRQASADLLQISSPIDGSINFWVLPDSQRYWSRVRGAVHMGVFSEREGKKKK
eukprot:g65713.t1